MSNNHNDYNDFYNDEEYLKLIEILESGNLEELENVMSNSNIVFNDVDSDLYNGNSGNNGSSGNDVHNNVDNCVQCGIDDCQNYDTNTQYNVDESENPEMEKMIKRNGKNRCGECNSKLKLINYTCKCAITFCGKHRMPENHKCFYDHKGNSRKILEKNNPIIVKDKLNRI